MASFMGDLVKKVLPGANPTAPVPNPIVTAMSSPLGGMGTSPMVQASMGGNVTNPSMDNPSGMGGSVTNPSMDNPSGIASTSGVPKRTASTSAALSQTITDAPLADFSSDGVDSLGNEKVKYRGTKSTTSSILLGA